MTHNQTTSPSQPTSEQQELWADTYVTASYSCSYLPQLARSQVVLPPENRDVEIYNELIQQGYRRGGDYIYRPLCDYCQSCVPIRIPVEQFVARRSQRRCLIHNSHLQTEIRPLAYLQEHFDLYQRYQIARHYEANSTQNIEDNFRFLLLSRVNSLLVEFREENVLRMVSLIDEVADGLSAVYTFYDPSLPSMGLGTYNVLWQIAKTASLGLPYLYLGYWVKSSNKMAYKSNFKPHELYADQQWTIQL